MKTRPEEPALHRLFITGLLGRCRSDMVQRKMWAESFEVLRGRAKCAEIRLADA